MGGWGETFREYTDTIDYNEDVGRFLKARLMVAPESSIVIDRDPHSNHKT